MTAGTGSLCTYGMNAMLTASAAAAGTQRYLALFTADPGVAGALTSEVSGAGYPRQPVTLSNSNGKATNPSDITFPPYTGTDNPVVTYVALVDSATTGQGNMFGRAAANPSQTLTSGANVEFQIKAGQLAFDLTAYNA